MRNLWRIVVQHRDEKEEIKTEICEGELSKKKLIGWGRSWGERLTETSGVAKVSGLVDHLVVGAQ